MAEGCQVCDNISSSKFILFEDEDIAVYLEENAASLAHITVTTKKHYPTMLAVPDYLVAWCFAIASKISRVLFASLSIQGLNWLVQIGASAGQEHEHFTLNLLPRLEKDGLELRWTPKKAEPSELKSIQERYKSSTSRKWLFESKSGPVGSETHQEEEVIKQEEGKENYLIKQLNRIP
ncbi:hypothetical protein DRJ48_00915 [Candidatus Woesearchaeota archaeon]|nr:HIT family protein [Candidatus Woesearchaeota archaeon]RLE43432.1 MAG: hypothetical protein DRJ48_00915 [Candidatus Woesearchaeota archaeon]